MDIARPEFKRQKRRRQIIWGAIGLDCLSAVTVGGLAPQAGSPEVERSTVWTDTVKRGPMLRQVRGFGSLIPSQEFTRQIPTKTEATVVRIRMLPGSRVKADTAPWLRIVGVTGNVSHTIVFQEMGYVITPFVLRPITQSADDPMSLVVRTSGNPLALAPAVQRTISDIDGRVPLYDLKSMDKVMSAVLVHPRFRAVMLGAFAAMALLLVAVGLYDVLSQSVVHRTHEIGIRMALGADPQSVLRMTVSRGMALALLGLSVGLVCALAAARLLTSLLYAVRPSDPFTLILVAVILSAVSFFACYIPARRAAKVDPWWRSGTSSSFCFWDLLERNAI